MGGTEQIGKTKLSSETQGLSWKELSLGAILLFKAVTFQPTVSEQRLVVSTGALLVSDTQLLVSDRLPAVAVVLPFVSAVQRNISATQGVVSIVLPLVSCEQPVGTIIEVKVDVMRTHVGKKIKQVAFEKRVTVKKLARAIGMSPQAVNKMFRRAIIHPKWIPALNKALQHDFWQYYASDETPDVPQAEPAEVAQLRKEIAELRKELAYLKEINAFLRKSA